MQRDWQALLNDSISSFRCFFCIILERMAYSLALFPFFFNVFSFSIDKIYLQIRDFRTDWDLQVNQPIAGNYYPVCFI